MFEELMVIILFIIALIPGVLIYPLLINKAEKFQISNIPQYFALGLTFSTLLSLVFFLFNLFSLIVFYGLIILSIFGLLYLNYVRFHAQDERFSHFILHHLKSFFHITSSTRKNKKEILIMGCFLIYSVGIYIFIALHIGFPQYDSWVYLSKSVNVMNYKFSLFQHFASYVDNIINSNFISYFWAFLFYPIRENILIQSYFLNYFLPILQLIIFQITLKRIIDKLKISLAQSLGIFIASMNLFTWVSFALPSSISLIFLLLFVESRYSKAEKNNLLALIYLGIIFLFHRTTFILILLGVVIYQSRDILKWGKKIYQIHVKNQESKRRKQILIIFSFGILILIGCIYLLFQIPFIQNSIQTLFGLYSTRNVFVRYTMYSQKVWITELSGPLILGLGVLFYILQKKYDKQHPVEEKRMINFYYFFFWMLIIICLLLPFWNIISHFPYLYYRYFVFIDVCLIFLGPACIKLINEKINSIKTKISSINKNRIVKIILVCFWCQIFLFSYFRFSSYYFYTYYQAFIPQSYINSYFQFKEDINPNSLILIYPSPLTMFGNAYSDTIFYDRYIIDYTQAENLFDNKSFYYNESDYDPTNRSYLYENLINMTKVYNNLVYYIFNQTKIMQENGRTLEESNFTTNRTINYIIIDNNLYPYLIRLMNNNTSIFQCVHEVKVSQPINVNFQQQFVIHYSVFLYKINKNS